ncbi:MAG: thioredoxin family protein [Armatimonadota bacterium]|nr:thioredoxin family protein [Armatimonadota bacterium]MDR7387734.1 thioredoxin family protein [Armatimonadota bacterium]MDR7390193.1 thioredoxin family protein [Armatimonadota bacterium]MDR7397482.1 thioredoxin family protein [Armatimonadota bacterium]MDR7400595.1 thioredoxin family protein [Armatimonadota bacterium]
MNLLKPQDREALRRRFEKELVGDVTLTLFTTSRAGLALPGADCETCEATQQLLEEVAALDPRIHLKVRSIVTDAEEARAAGVEGVPAILIGEDGQARARYYGIPAGLEFAVLVEDILAASRADSGLKPETRRALARLQRPVHIRVFVTPTCPYCPGVARLAHAMAQESEKIRADVVEAMEFPELADRYGVMGVPKVVLNEAWSFEGARPEEAFLQYVLQASGAAEPAPQVQR